MHALRSYLTFVIPMLKNTTCEHRIPISKQPQTNNSILQRMDENHIPKQEVGTKEIVDAE